MLFNGAGIAEKIDIDGNGGRGSSATSPPSPWTSTTSGIQFNALGGAIDIVVSDLSGTDVKQVNLDLSAQAGSGQGDGAADTVTANGTQGNDTITASPAAAPRWSSTASAKVTIASAEEANDQLVINATTVERHHQRLRSQRRADRLRSTAALGIDTITGSKGDDLINGGDGGDIAGMGAGNDTFVWNRG